MKTPEEILDASIKETLTCLQQEVRNGLQKARNKERLIELRLNNANTEYQDILLPLINIGVTYDFFDWAADIYQLDKSLSMADAIIATFRDFKVQLTEDNISKIAHLQALSDFIDWLKEAPELAEYRTVKHNPITHNRNPYWIGQEETEFIQLMYALVEAKRLTEKGKTKMVEEIARFFGFPLSKNWQSNLSKSIHKNNSNYSPAIFDELKPAWDRYTEKQEDKMYK
jgi:hypothetical protein